MRNNRRGNKKLSINDHDINVREMKEEYPLLDTQPNNVFIFTPKWISDIMK